jgi:hypothetical protein
MAAYAQVQCKYNVMRKLCQFLNFAAYNLLYFRKKPTEFNQWSTVGAFFILLFLLLTIKYPAAGTKENVCKTAELIPSSRPKLNRVPDTATQPPLFYFR